MDDLDRNAGTPIDDVPDVHRLVDGVVAAAAERPRREVTVKMAGEDLRVLIARCLLFVDSGRYALPTLTRIRIEFGERWAQGFAADGYTLCVQKMRCEASEPGTLILDAYDAARIAAIIPKATEKHPTEDVSLTFVSGGTEAQRRPANAMYEEAGRVGSYSCEGAFTGPPAFDGIFSALAKYDTPAVARFAMQPDFLVQVAKASAASKEQQPYVVRFYVSGEHPSREKDVALPGPLVARFSCAPQHDQFVAVLQPLIVQWTEGDALARVLREVRSLRGEADRFRPKPVQLTDEAGS